MESTISSYLGFMFSNKPMSRLDSDPDYLLTQYISDFAKYLGMMELNILAQLIKFPIMLHYLIYQPVIAYTIEIFDWRFGL